MKKDRSCERSFLYRGVAAGARHVSSLPYAGEGEGSHQRIQGTDHQSKIASCLPGSITAALLFVERAHKADDLVEQDHKGDQPLLSVCDMTRLKAFFDHPSIVFPAICLLPLQRFQ